MMKTQLLTEEQINKAAQIIKDGGLVAMPTETVYGLAADALNGNAVAKIFKAKGRPMDNPLIVHIAALHDIERLAACFPEKARRLASSFWPGPLTIVLPKSGLIPDEVSAGLDTVGIRFPAHPLAQALIKESGTPLAAPSANRSGIPSPTAARHVLQDMDGRIEAVLDGGECRVGVESTVITLAGDRPRLLRPGGVTLEQMEAVIGKIDVDDAVLHRLKDGVKAASPGMKYRHYAPKAHVVLIKAADQKYIDYVNNHADEQTACMCFEEDVAALRAGKAYPLGEKEDALCQARVLFSTLRQIDDDGMTLVYARCPETDGVGMAVYNRLIRAAGFEVKELA